MKLSAVISVNMSAIISTGCNETEKTKEA